MRLSGQLITEYSEEWYLHDVLLALSTHCLPLESSEDGVS